MVRTRGEIGKVLFAGCELYLYYIEWRGKWKGCRRVVGRSIEGYR